MLWENIFLEIINYVHDCINLKTPSVTGHTCLLFTANEDGHLTCLCLFAIVNFAAADSGISFSHLFSIWGGYFYKWVCWPHGICFCAVEISALYADHFNFSQAMFKGSNFSTSLLPFVSFCFLDYSLASVFEGASHWF